jgi:hypothetical protein
VLPVSIFVDSSFVGSIEKDSAELQAEHKSLFETANAKDVNKVRNSRHYASAVLFATNV